MFTLDSSEDFRGARTVQNLPLVQKTWIQSLGQQEPSGKGSAARSSMLAWGIPWTEEPGGLVAHGITEWSITE